MVTFDVLVTCALGALLVAGCAAEVPPPPETVTAEVPVMTPVYCNVQIPAKPALPLASLTPDSVPADTVRAYAASVALLKAAVVERDSLLRSCQAPGSQTDDDNSAEAPR